MVEFGLASPSVYSLYMVVSSELTRISLWVSVSIARLLQQQWCDVGVLVGNISSFAACLASLAMMISIPTSLFPPYVYNFYYGLCVFYVKIFPLQVCVAFLLWTYLMIEDRKYEDQSAAYPRYELHTEDVIEDLPNPRVVIAQNEDESSVISTIVDHIYPRDPGDTNHYWYDDTSEESSYHPEDDNDTIASPESEDSSYYLHNDDDDDSEYDRQRREHIIFSLYEGSENDEWISDSDVDSDATSSTASLTDDEEDSLAYESDDDLPELVNDRGENFENMTGVFDIDEYALMYPERVASWQENSSLCAFQLRDPDIKVTDLAACILAENLLPPPLVEPEIQEMFDHRLDLGLADERIDPELFDSALSYSDFAEPTAWLEDQSGEAGAALRESFKHFKNSNPEMAAAFSHLETIMILIVNLSDVNSARGVISALSLYVKTLSPELNANGLVMSLLEQIVELPMTEQSEDTPEPELPDWIAGLKSGKANWNLLRNNPLFEKVSQICSLLVSLGLCSSAAIDFSLGGYKLFSGAVAPKHATALDLFDALSDTFVYFIEGGWKCYATGSIAPLLLGDDEISVLIEKITKCENYARLYKNGNIAEENGCMFDENKLETMFVETIASCNDLLRTTDSATLKKILLDKRSRLQTCHSDFAETRLKGGLRIQPYCAGFHGRSCKGKSYLAAITMAVILRCNHFAYGDKHMTTLNANDQFWSTFRSDTSGVFLDDMGNENPDYCKVNPTRILLDLVNNVRIYANKAEIESKGRVSVEPRVVIVTKNVKDGNARVYSCEPVAITRRENVIITVECRPEAMVNGKLDPRLAAHIPKRNGMDDLWLLTLETSFGENNNGAEHDKVAYAAVRSHKTGLPMIEVSLAEALEWMIQDSATWFVEQRKLVERSTEVTNHLEWCDGCNRPGALCSCDFQDAASFSSSAPSAITDPGEAEESDDDSEVTEWTYPDNNQYTEQSGVLESLLMTVLTSFYHKWYNWALSFFPYVLRDIDRLTANECLSFLGCLEESYWFVWTNYIPEHWMHTDFMKKLIIRRTPWKTWFESSWQIIFNYFLVALFLYWCGIFPTVSVANVLWSIATIWTVDIFQKASTVNITHLGMFWDCSVCVILWIFTIWSGLCSPAYFTILFCFTFSVCLKNMMKRCEERLLERVSEERETLPWIFSTYREKYIEGLTTLFFAAGGVYLCVKMYKAYNTKMIESQSDLDPENVDDVANRDAKAGLMKRVAQQFNWDGFQAEEVFDCQRACSTTSQEQMIAKIAANTCHIQGNYKDENGVDKTVVNQAFFPCSNVALIPTHMLNKHPKIICKFTRMEADKIGPNFDGEIDIANAVNIPNTDMSLVNISNGGSWKDLTEYFPLTSPGQHRGIFVHKNASGTVYTCNTKLTPERIVTQSSSYDGYKYDLACDTKGGMCMSPIIGVGKKRIISGFHLAGYSGTVHGAAGKLTYGQLMAAKAVVDGYPHVLNCASKTDRPDRVYDTQYLLSEDLHPKSPLNYVENPSVIFSGSVAGRSTFRSATHKTKISDTVEEITGQKCVWQSPPVKIANPWFETLKHLVNPTKGVPGALLRRAVEDYGSQIKNMIDKIPSVKSSIKKLTRVQTVSGIDGCRFVDAIKWDTAINYMVPGKKEKIKIDLPKDDYPDFACPRDLPEWVWAQVAIMETRYLKGECSYEIFKACLKDEPVHVSKTKVRVFEACPLALALMLRMYFLPVARAMSLFPLRSECAVGINVHGPEWDELRSHITKYGVDRILAGDYSKYDLRMPAQLTLAAFKFLISMAEYTGNYSEDDLKIMHGLATDVCYPKVAYNGDLLELLCSNPSGHSLTVYINSIVNSILFRCGFFDAYPDTKFKFEEACALTTYGDDAKSSVHASFPKFNHISYATFLSQYGIVFTMPDKESVATEYMNDGDADFLKNKSVWCESAQVYMAALDELSIFKSLHFVGDSSLSDDAQAVSNIDGALREWFSHGPEIYEMRRAQMIEVAARHNLTGWCDQLDVTYEKAMHRWVKTYYSED